MSDVPIAVGLNLGHDGGCAIVAGNRVVAIAEERLNRTRYSGGWQAALAYCLEAADLTLADVGVVVFSCVGPRLDEGFTGGLERYGVDARRIVSVDHHLSHAYGAFCLSDADEALVVVADGSGNDHQTESYFLADRTGLTRVGGNRTGRARAGGIGATYEAVTNWLGFDGQESGKTMALASYGDPKAIDLQLFDVTDAQVEGRLERTHDRGLVELAAASGLDLGRPYAWAEPRARDLAAWVQAQTEDALAEVVTHLMAEHRQTNVCFAGGVAMNCVANEAIRRRTGANLFVPPPASDRGQALGNALHGVHLLTGRIPRMPLPGRDSFGRVYTDAEIHLALRRHPAAGLAERYPHRAFAYRRESDPATAAAELIAQGKLIGWFDGGSELGARALGSRSILADPRKGATRDVLNTRVKHREFFRPFAPAVPAEHAGAWFETDRPSPYMLFASQARARHRDQIAAVTHVDGSARLQTVDGTAHPAFHRLITRFGDITGVTVVLNTSFNDTEPIVETPAHAVATFCRTDLDALVFSGGFVAVKTDA
ncbi:carbamoyltransferase [Streptomyces sp. NRRL F-5126]|uniref:carbamoyltransferase family protein n=1 Tax=Streptomyces sp. NRRL F-5126 TaxID=1463857 RepID=UPI00069165E5|nr:carbamoyltransferase C-terminal domain-containing protein [Streptomyces sp. NRRL F-5126]